MKIFFRNCVFNPRNDRHVQQLSTDTGAQFPVAGDSSRVKLFYTSRKRVKKFGNSLHVVPNALVDPRRTRTLQRRGPQRPCETKTYRGRAEIPIIRLPRWSPHTPYRGRYGLSSAGRRITTPSGGIRKDTEQGRLFQGISSAVTWPRLPTPEPP